MIPCKINRKSEKSETNKRYVTDVELKAFTEIFHVSYEYL